MFRAGNLLSSSPLRWQREERSDFLALRFWVVHPYSKYMIVYDPSMQPIGIARILHGSQDLEALFRDNPP